MNWVLKSKEFVLFDGIEMAPRSLFREPRGRREEEVPGNPERLFWLVKSPSIQFMLPSSLPSIVN